MKKIKQETLPAAKTRTPEQIAAHLELLVGGIAKVVSDASKPGRYRVSFPFTLDDATNNVDQLETQLMNGVNDLSDVLRDVADALEDWGDAIVKARLKITAA